MKMADMKENSLLEEDDSCCESRGRDNSYSTGSLTPSSSSDYMTGDADESSEGKGAVPPSLKSVEATLTISKDTTETELHEMVDTCKAMVLESAECSLERKWFVRRLIELRLRIREIQDSSDEKIYELQLVRGHHFKPQEYYISTTNPVYCDHCGGAIWTMLQYWYKCNDCNYCCHWNCLPNVNRLCAHVVASEIGYRHLVDICPEKGLSKQSYSCAECKMWLMSRLGSVEKRRCDYNGLYYCQKCHWNTPMIIPARVIRNWDWEPRPVSRTAAQLLTLLENRPLILLEKLNPKLFTLVPDLSLVKRMREEMQMMKKYLIVCAQATAQGLPWKTGLRPHMIENAANYSVRDLTDLRYGLLLDELRATYEAMQAHIMKKCKLCRARGHLCEICSNDEIIFPWDASSVICPQCSAVHHRVCWSKCNHNCPRCARLQKRLALERVTARENEDRDADDVAMEIAKDS